MPYQGSTTRSFSVEFAKPTGGLVTSRRPEELKQKVIYGDYGNTIIPLECSELENLRFSKQDGEFVALVSRPGLEEVETAADLSAVAGVTINIESMVLVQVAGGAHLVATASDDNLYALDLTASPPSWSKIDQADSAASLLTIGLLYGDEAGENAVLVQEPGRMPHLYRPNASASRLFHVCFDRSGYMTDEITGKVESTGIQLYAGSTTKAGNEQTLDTWCYHTGDVDKIPIITLEARLRAYGAPTGSVVAEIYDGTTLIATSQSIDASAIPTGTWTTFTFVFDGTVLRAPGGTYKEVIAYSGGDSANYVEVADSGSGGLAVTYNAGWSTGSGTVLISTTPGLAKTGEYAIGYQSRVLLAKPEGRDGYFAYSNVLDPMDWSAPAASTGELPAAGEIAVGGADGSVDAMVPLHESLYILKTDSFGTVYKLSGTGPATFSLSTVMSGIQPKGQVLAVNAGNFALALTSKGLVSLSIIADNKELNEAIKSHQVSNLTSGFTKAVYIPGEQQVWFFGDSKVYVYDVEVDAWTSYSFQVTPAAAVNHGSGAYVAEEGSGKIYRLADGRSKDGDTAFSLVFQTAATDAGNSFDRKLARRLSLTCHAKVGGEGTLKLYKDTANVANFERSLSIPVDPDTTVGDLYGVTVGELYGVSVGGSDYKGIYFYNSNLAGAGSYAGIDLSQFNYLAAGPKQLATDYVVRYPYGHVMIRLEITSFIKSFRLNALALKGFYIGRRIA